MTAPSPKRESLDLGGWWHTWFDEKAAWRDEIPVLPGGILAGLPSRPPSSGWEDMETGMESLPVPGTWAQSRPGYQGVAWHWRPFIVPDHWAGRVVRLRFEAVRLRAEVYLDRELVGYDLEGLTPFEVHLTERVHAGKRHELALRVTNADGRGSPIDREPLVWGDVELPNSHDWGGIWGDVALIASSPAYIEEAFAIPQQDLCSVMLRARIHNHKQARAGRLSARAIDQEGRLVGAATSGELYLAADSDSEVSLSLRIADARPWSPDAPYLYQAHLTMESEGWADTLSIHFGLRHIEARDGQLFLNGQRVRLRCATHWGLYPDTLAFPSASLAQREVAAARSLGLNALRAYNQPLPPALLDAADHGGLLICQHFGLDHFGGQRAWLEQRVRRLLRRDRNHPCIVALDLPVGVDASTRDLAQCLIQVEDGMRVTGREEPKPLGIDGACLPDIPALVRRFGDRVLPGSEAAHWRLWQERLQADLQALGESGSVEGLSSFCQATGEAHGAALQRALEQRLFCSDDDVEVGGWANHLPLGAPGIVDSFRRPLLGAQRLARANTARALYVPQMPTQMRHGEICKLEVWALNRADPLPEAEVCLQTVGPQGQVLSEVVWSCALPGGGRRTCLGIYTLQAHIEGLCELRARLSSGDGILEVTYRFWVSRLPASIPAGLPWIDASGRLALIQERWQARWSQYAAGRAGGLLVVDDAEALLRALSQGQHVRRAALLASDAACATAIGQSLAVSGLAPANLLAFELSGSATWVFSKEHYLLEGVTPAGMWGPIQEGLTPCAAWRGLHGRMLVAACSATPWTRDAIALPRMGMALAEVSLENTRVLLCALPVLDGALRGLPSAERLLYNIAAWLVEA